MSHIEGVIRSPSSRAQVNLILPMCLHSHSDRISRFASHTRVSKSDLKDPQDTSLLARDLEDRLSSICQHVWAGGIL